MVKGIDVFRSFFREYDSAYVVIGGVACDVWFSEQGLTFRITKDVDMVLLLESHDEAFAARLWEFVEAGQYDCRQKSTGKRIYYRFHTPGAPEYPDQIELFSRTPPGIDLYPGQQITPIPADEDVSSLSAILLDDDYYDLVIQNRELRDGLPLVQPAALIALKAAAWLDLRQRKDKGENVDEKHLKKHRNDVFRLANILPVGTHLRLPQTVANDLSEFLGMHPEGSAEWDGILASVKTTVPSPMSPGDLQKFIHDFFSL